MKHIYINAFTATNAGDDLFVKVLCERYPQHHFYMECEVKHSAAFSIIPNLTLFHRSTQVGKWHQRLKKWSTQFSNSLGIRLPFSYDAQVYIGGSIFIEFKDPVSYQSYFEKLYNAKICSKIPFFIIGANFGPYHTEDFLEKHSQYFSQHVDDLCMRDRKSHALFQNLPNVRYAPDILFTCPMPAMKKKNLIVISCIFDDTREEIQRFDNTSYEEKLCQLCEYYLSFGKEVCLLSMCQQQHDHITCKNVQKRFSKGVHVTEYRGNTEELIQLFAQAEYVIAARFHATILSWLANTPVFPIYYSNKTLNVIKDYGFCGSYASIGDFSNLSCEFIDQNRMHPSSFAVDTLKQEAQNHFSKLDLLLN